MKKVVKFGGSSLASALQFKKVGAIIREDESRRYVVPSAPGKRFAAEKDFMLTYNRTAPHCLDTDLPAIPLSTLPLRSNL